VKLILVFRRSLLEQARDLLTLSLTLAFAPLFVLLYWLFFPGGSTTYDVLVLNHDAGTQPANELRLDGGSGLIEAMNAVTYADGKPLLKVRLVSDRAAAESRLKDRDAEVLLIVPADFSDTLQSARQGAGTPGGDSLIFVGDLTNPYYAVAAVMANAAIDQYIGAATGQERPVGLLEQPLGGSSARSEFEIYVPGLLVFAVIMLIFGASMTVAQEVESGTLQRLRITRLRTWEFLAGMSAAQVVVGVASMLLAFATAIALGFHSQGPLWVAILVSSLTALSIVGMGLVVASFSKSVSQAFVIANFPLAFFMFFSGAIFPIPRIPLFTLAGRTIGLYDILPPTHAVVALNKVLTLGAGLADVIFELSALALLTFFYYAIGVWLFRRTHMKASW
jgi:ABC-2 type transport system permease protein